MSSLSPYSIDRNCIDVIQKTNHQGNATLLLCCQTTCCFYNPTAATKKDYFFIIAAILATNLCATVIVSRVGHMFKRFQERIKPHIPKSVTDLHASQNRDILRRLFKVKGSSKHTTFFTSPN